VFGSPASGHHSRSPGSNSRGDQEKEAWLLVAQVLCLLLCTPTFGTVLRIVRFCK
jgi:hypothetical protein